MFAAQATPVTFIELFCSVSLATFACTAALWRVAACGLCSKQVRHWFAGLGLCVSTCGPCLHQLCSSWCTFPRQCQLAWPSRRMHIFSQDCWMQRNATSAASQQRLSAKPSIHLNQVMGPCQCVLSCWASIGSDKSGLMLPLETGDPVHAALRAQRRQSSSCCTACHLLRPFSRLLLTICALRMVRPALPFVVPLHLKQRSSGLG